MKSLTIKIFVFLFFPLFLFSGFAFSANKQGRQKYWIFFRDKGPIAADTFADIGNRLLPKTRHRRAKVMRSGSLVDYTDVPVWRPYLDSLSSRSIKPIVVSKWLNAASAVLSKKQKRDISQKPFVSHIQPVMTAKRRPVTEVKPLGKASVFPQNYVYDYGQSLAQNELINIPKVHDLGISGQGVLVAVFDTGFRLNHLAFEHLHVVAAYDFINKDATVDNEEGQDTGGQNWHGTIILSMLAGFFPGQLIGSAFGADVLLAKTEDVSSETPVEEDNWIAAAEWADSLGADVISTSLGYLDWYSYKDMDGKTAPITIAADLAVKKGIVVVVAAGNEGNSAWHYIDAPADGDSVITVGAVDSGGVLADFSSRGPTFDGRIKPDIVAMGVGNVGVAVPPREGIGSGFTNVSGTSAACPMAAGVAALILSAYPNLTPMQVREALLKTADRATDPDNNYGYGLVDAYAALMYWGEPEGLPEKTELAGAYPNPFRVSKNHIMQINFDLTQPTNVSGEIFNGLGQSVKTFAKTLHTAGKNQRLLWNGQNDFGELLPSGIYFCSLKLGTEIHHLKITLLE
ncbi:MAG: S8 family serine peptidase [Calditrichaeota bacterium]|nr:S8 family serine peptidase [Calditrichota bacterium]